MMLRMRAPVLLHTAGDQENIRLIFAALAGWTDPSHRLERPLRKGSRAILPPARATLFPPLFASP